MQQKKSFFITLLFLTVAPVLFDGCNFHRNSSGEAARPKAFPHVSVPSMLSGQEAADYAATHFWNSYFDSTKVWLDISDTLLGGVSEENLTNAMREYLIALWSVPYDRATDAQKRLMSLAEASLGSDTSGRIYDYFTSTLESALWNPQSELRNEGLYIPVVESILRTGRTGEHFSSYYRQQLDMCMNNRPGEPAADFYFTDSRGNLRSLYEVQAEYTLLLFSNPGCPACREIIATLQNSSLVTSMQAEGHMAMLSIYIDEDIAEWYRGLSDYPDTWITGYNHDLAVRDGMLYDVRAIPSLYLLDSEKNVIFKDISAGMLMLLLPGMIQG